jgi:hypothetical protein
MGDEYRLGPSSESSSLHPIKRSGPPVLLPDETAGWGGGGGGEQIASPTFAVAIVHKKEPVAIN